MGSDQISRLPDEILGIILSSVPTKTAASTSVLSKSLSFDELNEEEKEEDQEDAMSSSQPFHDFMEKTFALLSNSPIKKVSLSHLPFHYSDHSRVYSWIYTAMDRVKRVYFPVLKSLSLEFLELDYPDYHRLLDGCPTLEELFVADDDDHSNPLCCGAVVKSESLKRLVVSIDLPDSQEDHNSMLLDTPSLVYLKYTSYVFKEHDAVGLDLLVEARLDLSLWESTSDYDDDDDDDVDDEEEDDNETDDDEPKMPIFGDVTKLVVGITNITTLHLSADSLETFHFCCESMPVFNNLLNLSIESDREKGWQVMPILLKSCPRLHTFEIKGLVHRETNKCGDACACIPGKHKEGVEEVCCLLTCQVKVLEISDYIGSSQELKQMRHFLGKLKFLESVDVSIDANNDNSELLRNNLLTLPRISSKCDIQFI
ncbi:BnaA02g18030D [Brassica napus]|uniref:BnaA02g18030D protein n=1 Tax=Brassica napus TaxID=3708 RepID=A0A078I9Z6_BRANA|nr:BnaA02g18030D [Brassica napus]